MHGSVRIGTAGWTLPRAWQDAFPVGGSHLERYAAVFSGAEINSSFYRHHRRAVYERWAAAVPAGFRFAVKLPRTITHDQSLVAADVPLAVFLEETCGLGDKLGPLLVQLPPSLQFVPDHAEEFFTLLRAVHAGDVVCEPRNETWFRLDAGDLMARHRIARVAADPARVSVAAEPGGWAGLRYYRLHGSPRMYYSDYSRQHLSMVEAGLRAHHGAGADIWCIFDNTTLGAATGNALTLARAIGPLQDSP